MELIFSPNVYHLQGVMSILRSNERPLAAVLIGQIESGESVATAVC